MCKSMVINQQSLKGLDVAYSARFNNAFETAEVNYPKVAMQVASTTRETTYAWMGQIPNIREWIGERTIQSFSTYAYSIVNKTYECTVAVPANDIADDLYGVYAPLMAEMGLNARKHPDELVFGLMAKGFEELSYDAVPFFSENHPIDLDKKRKQSNKGTKQLSLKTYSDARAQMMTIKGDQNKLLGIIPDTLVVAPQNEGIAREILFSEKINGTTNVYKNTCELLVIPELTEYPDQWYLLCTKRYVKPFVFQEREQTRLISKTADNDDNVFIQNEFLYGTKGRYNVGYGLWQFAYGSTGEDKQENEQGNKQDATEKQSKEE